MASSRTGVLLSTIKLKIANEDIPNNNVTLFFGLAGIGYELIRFTDPVFYGTVL